MWGWAEAANVAVASSLLTTFLVTLIVAASNNGFVDIDATGIDNSTLASLHYAADTVSTSLSPLDMDVAETITLSCRLAEVSCPSKLSGVAVTSIVTGVLVVPSFLLGIYLRSRRLRTYGMTGGRRKLRDYPNY